MASKQISMKRLFVVVVEKGWLKVIMEISSSIRSHNTVLDWEHINVFDSFVEANNFLLIEYRQFFDDFALTASGSMRFSTFLVADVLDWIAFASRLTTARQIITPD